MAEVMGSGRGTGRVECGQAGELVKRDVGKGKGGKGWTRGWEVIQIKVKSEGGKKS